MSSIVKKVKKTISGAVDAVVDVVSDTVDAVVDIVDDIVDAVVEIHNEIAEVVIDAYLEVWHEVVAPILEDIFAFFGIEDETLLFVDKTSVLLLEDTVEDPILAAQKRAAIRLGSSGESFFTGYLRETTQVKSSLTAYYLYGKNTYIYGEPKINVNASLLDLPALDASLNAAIGTTCIRLTQKIVFPTDSTYFQNSIQRAPYLYIPGENTLTFKGSDGVRRSDYSFVSVTFNAFSQKYFINIQRQAEQALFWIEGPSYVVEGNSAVYTVKVNRPVPAGKSVNVTLSYTQSGVTTPVDDYVGETSLTLNAGDTEGTITVITTDRDSAIQGKSFTATLNPIVDSNNAFELVGLHTASSVTTAIVVTDGIVLTTPAVFVSEATGSAVIPVKLENGSTGAFTVDYSMADITAVNGLDYIGVSGTLNFIGTTGEIQEITIPITSDNPDDNETFTVQFSNVSDGAVNISQVCLVTIQDGSNSSPLPGTVSVLEVIRRNPYKKERTAIVTYHKATDPATKWYYWLYKTDSGKYDITDERETLEGIDLLPLAIIRKDRKFINIDKETQEYKTTRGLLARVNLDIDEIIANIASNDDTGVGNLDDAFINFGVSPSTDNWIVSKILYLSFYEIAVVNGIVSNNDEYSITIEEQDVQNALVLSKHTATTNELGFLANGEDYHHYIDGDDLYMQYRTGPGKYDQIVVEKLNAMATIKYDGYSQVALNTVSDTSFVVHLSYFVLSKLSAEEQLRGYRYMLRLDLYSAELIHIKWYEQPEFLDLFQIVIIVVTLITAGILSSPLIALQQLLINIAILQIVVYIAELTGNAELAAVVGIVAAIVLADASGVPLDFSSAEGLVAASTNFANNLTAAYDVLGQELAQDINDLNAAVEVRLEEIKDANPEEPAVDAEFLVALKSVDTGVYPAIKAQYNFDLIYNYDRIVADYYDINLNTGVI